MKNVAIIPARGGSKRLPDKNMMLLDGIPLLAHSILFAQKSNVIDEVYVSTDSEKIKAIAREYHANVIDRPESLSGDHEPTSSAVQHCLENIPHTVENIFLLQPTNPLRPAGLIEDAFTAFQQQNTDSLITVTRNHQKFGRIDQGKFVPYNYEPGQRSQDLEPLYFENGLLYISTAKLIKDGRIFSENAYPFIIDHVFGHIDIDVLEDFDRAVFLLNNLRK